MLAGWGVGSSERWILEGLDSERPEGWIPTGLDSEGLDSEGLDSERLDSERLDSEGLEGESWECDRESEKRSDPRWAGSIALGWGSRLSDLDGLDGDESKSAWRAGGENPGDGLSWDCDRVGGTGDG
jgi:hypothetical protein